MLVADDHPLFRAGIRSVLERDRQFAVVAETADGESCIAQAELLRPDIAIMDLSMPGRNGFEVAEWLAASLPETRRVILSMHADRAYVERAMRLGTDAFIAKEDVGAELLQALAAPRGRFYMSASCGRPPPPRLEQADDPVVALIAGLTRTEREILAMIAAGATTRQIAAERGISERTVQTHRQNVSAKLGVGGAHSLLSFAMRYRTLLSVR